MTQFNQSFSSYVRRLAEQALREWREEGKLPPVPQDAREKDLLEENAVESAGPIFIIGPDTIETFDDLEQSEEPKE
ncbi:MAG: hypothetical protein AAFY03_00065 [Pseudomonadota bacterium]